MPVDELLAELEGAREWPQHEQDLLALCIFCAFEFSERPDLDALSDILKHRKLLSREIASSGMDQRNSIIQRRK